MKSKSPILLPCSLLAIVQFSCASLAQSFPVTLPASNLFNDTATLNGAINPAGAVTTAWFEWGQYTAYSSITAPSFVGSGTNSVAINAALTGLSPGAIYHYRCIVSNSLGVARGVDQAFWSPALNLNGPNPIIHESHLPLVDPGATTKGSPPAIAAGIDHSLALKADGTVVGWGRNDFGQTNVSASATNVIAITAGSYHSLSLRSDGTIIAWGRNDYGQTAIPASATNVVAVAAGQYHSLALKVDGRVVGWGRNNFNQATIPAGLTNVVAIAAGESHSLALHANGMVVGWGKDNFGQATIPTSATNVMAIAAGESHSLALKADGTVVGWGRNNFGQTTIPNSATNVIAIAVGASHSLAIKADGSLVGWGENGSGQSTIPASATNVVAIAAGGSHSLSLRPDGSLVSWGNNNYGQTNGPANLNNLNLPIAVTGTVNVDSPGTYLLTYSTTNALGAAAAALRTVIVFGSPLVTTMSPSNLLNDLVTLKGAVNPQGADTTAWFEWGSAYAFENSTAPQSVGNSFNETPVTAELTGLTPGVTYQCRCVASNSLGVVRGTEIGFYLPVITLNGPNPMTNECHVPFVDPGTTGSGTITVSGTVNQNAPGTYLLNYSTTNELGAVATATRTVVVADTLPPVLTLLGANPLRLELRASLVDPGATATDLCAGDLTGSILAINSVNANLPGSYEITYKVMDAYGNRAEVTRTVIVFGPAQVNTLPASNMSNNLAKLKGTVNPQGLDTTGWLEWGLGYSYDNSTAPQSIASGFDAVQVNASLTGLTHGVIYQYRCVASNILGVVRGTNQSFWLPGMTLNGPNPLIQGWQTPFVDPLVSITGPPLAIAAGSIHSLALKGDGTVIVWGRESSSAPASATNVVAIAAGDWHNLALKADGTVVGWGQDYFGQATIPERVTNVVAIAAGGYHSLVLKADGTIIGWGDGWAIGIDESNVVAIATGYSHNLALKADGTVIGWGSDYFGQASIPPNATNVVAIAAGEFYSVVLKADGTVIAWGDNTYGVTNVPASATNVVAIARGIYHCLALKADGTVVGWGWNYYGQTDIPANASNVVAIAAGEWHSLALKADGTIVGWGNNGVRQATSPIGLNNLNLPIAVEETVDVDQPGTYALTYSTSNSLGAIANTTRNVIVLKAPSVGTLPASNPISSPLTGAITLNGTVDPVGENTTAWFEWGSTYAYGNSTEPQSIGSGTNVVGLNAGLTNLTIGRIFHYRCVASNSLAAAYGGDQTFSIWTPTLTLNGPNPMTIDRHAQFLDSGAIVSGPVLSIAAGYDHSLALKADGTVVGWGINNFGQTNCPASATNVMAIAGGVWQSLALKADGTVVAWGDNEYGQTTIPAGATNLSATAAGGYHSIAVKADRTVVGWGDNASSQITIPASATNVTAIVAGFLHNLALKADGTIVGWGSNDLGQLTIPASASNVVAIAAGFSHSLALKPNGKVVGWGWNANSQASVPGNLANVVAISAGQYHSLALKAGGTISGWGNNFYGQLSVPASATNIIEIASAASHNLALKLGGTVVAWGRNNYGQIAIPPDLNNLNLPIAVSGMVNTDNPGTYVLTYSATNELGIAATTTRTVVVLGTPLANTKSASNLLDDTATFNGTVNPQGSDTAAWFEWGSTFAYGNSTSPHGAGSGTNFMAVNAAVTGLSPGMTFHFRCVASNSFGVVRGNDQVFWSPAITLNSANPLTNECHVAFFDPTTVNGSVLAIAAGGSHTLGLKADGTVVGWGNNNYGQTSIPAIATNVIAIAAGGSHSLGVKADGTVAGWGLNSAAQTTIPASATNVLAIAAGLLHSQALKVDGRVVGWGWNPYGQATVPASATNVVAIAAGDYHSLALRADGTVVGWGKNDFGQTNIPASATNVVAIAAGSYHSLGRKADGTVVGWGVNNYGQTTIPASATNVVAIASGAYHGLALRVDGTVIGWGLNNYGQTTIPASATNIVAIVAGGSHSLALKSDGAILAWGNNDYGQTTVPFGLNSLNLSLAVSGTVAVDIPGTYVLTYSTTNALGAVATANRTVIVADTLPPILTLLGNNPLMHELGRPFVDPGSTAIDLCAGDMTLSIVSNINVVPNVSGTYTNTYSVSDSAGNGIQTNRIVVVITRPTITQIERLDGGSIRFTYTNTPGAHFRVLSSTNVSLTFSEWTALGPAIENPPGTFQFTDDNATNYPANFYRLVSP